MKQIEDNITIYPKNNIFGEVTAPASKSYAQRAIAIAALAEGISQITNLTLCNDTISALNVIETMGAKVTLKDDIYEIEGGISPKEDMTLNIGEAGLSARLFTPIASLFECETTITGNGSILSRPLGKVEEPLHQLGAEAHSNNGMLPIKIKGPIGGGKTLIDGSLGSQFLTGLLISMPLAKGDTTIEVEELRSIPYIDMTIETMRHFGVEIDNENYKKFEIKGRQTYSPAKYNIEGDWSGASCLLVAGAIAGDTKKGVRINNLNINSLQADLEIFKALKYAGVRVEFDENSLTTFCSETHGFTFDATHCPDLFPALVALAATAQGESVIIGTNRLIHKESNRAIVLCEVYKKMGIEIDISQDDIMKIKGGAIKGGMMIDSHNDHRIAMSIAAAALKADAPITITSSKAVEKSYGDFFDDMRKLKNE
ncbi:MAG: 3-phosphoshikimate 1-carboxyvinyltransferase [Rikenellaceae bacterium]